MLLLIEHLEYNRVAKLAKLNLEAVTVNSSFCEILRRSESDILSKKPELFWILSKLICSVGRGSS